MICKKREDESLGMWRSGHFLESREIYRTVDHIPHQGREEEQGAEHVLLVTGVELDLLVRTSKVIFAVAIYWSPPCGSKLVSWPNSGILQTVSFLSKSTYNNSSPSNSIVTWPLGP